MYTFSGIISRLYYNVSILFICTENLKEMLIIYFIVIFSFTLIVCNQLYSVLRVCSVRRKREKHKPVSPMNIDTVPK